MVRLGPTVEQKYLGSVPFAKGYGYVSLRETPSAASPTALLKGPTQERKQSVALLILFLKILIYNFNVYAVFKKV